MKWLANDGNNRFGFWLWYVIPLAALLSGHALFGAFLYGAYSGARSMAVWVIIPGPRRRTGGNAVGLWLLRQHGVARRLAASHLLLVGVAAAIAIGG